MLKARGKLLFPDLLRWFPFLHENAEIATKGIPITTCHVFLAARGLDQVNGKTLNIVGRTSHSFGYFEVSRHACPGIYSRIFFKLSEAIAFFNGT
jgi:hypothetical protein